MNDEACTHYDDIINNFLKGHTYLRDNLNIKPKTSWQIDPFGHSAFSARLYADMDYDSMFLNRIDEQERSIRIQRKDLSFWWEPQENLFGNSKRIFVSVLYDHYSFGED